jgi:hypothetical protein
MTEYERGMAESRDRREVAATLELLKNEAVEHVGWHVRFPSGIEHIQLSPIRTDIDVGEGDVGPVFRVMKEQR